MTDEMAPPSAPLEDDEAVERSSGSARLMSALRQAEARADRAERELARTKRSASYVVGNLLVRAAKDPRRLLTLPRDLWRIWRLRGARRAAPATRSGVIRTRDIVDLDAARLLIPRLATAPAGRGLSIAGALGAATARGWSPYAAVSSALPHDGAALIEALDPDVIIIDTSASLPGQPWAHLGNPAAVDRLQAAAAMVDAAHALGRPAVLLRMTPPAHTAFLSGLAARCDLVVDGPGSAPAGRRWHPGVDPLAPVGVAPAPAMLDLADWPEVSEQSPRAITIDPSLPTDAGWMRALGAASGVLAATVTPGTLGAGLTSVAALAAGRRLLAPGDDDLARMLAPWPTARDAVSTTRSRERLGALAAEGPPLLTDDEHRAVMAAILLSAAAPVQLTGLADALGIASRPRSCWDVALVAEDDIDIDRVLAQSWLPREIITAQPLSDRARDALAESGIDIIATDPGGRIDVALTGATSPYLAVQVDTGNPHDLVDLIAGHLLDQPARSHPTDARLLVSA